MLTAPAVAAENLAPVTRNVTVSPSLLAARTKSIQQQKFWHTGGPSQELLVLRIPPAGLDLSAEELQLTIQPLALQS